MPKRWDIEGKIKKFKAFERAVPRRVGNIALNHFLNSWDIEGFSNASINSDPWAKRKKQEKGGRRQLLVKTGHLKRSMKVAPNPTFRRIAVGSYGISYARFHNKGVSGRLPRRQFVGDSQILNKKIRILITNELKKIL